MNIKSQEKLINMLFESSENPVVTTEEGRFHLEDCIQYVTKPGVIVATIKGKSKYGVQQLPIGAVDNFRFMKVTNEEAIMEQEKNNGKSYEQLMDEYEQEKGKILEQWKSANEMKFNEITGKYGDNFIGMDIIQNEKKFQPKSDEEEGKEGTETQKPSKDGIVSEEDKNKDEALNTATKDIAEFLKSNEEKMFELSDEKMDELRKKSANKNFFKKVDEIAEKYVGDKTPDQIDKNTQTQIMKELYKIEKEEPKELQDYKPEDFKKDGLQNVDKYQNAVDVIQQKKQEKENSKPVTDKGEEQLNEGFMEVLGAIFGGLTGIFKLAWSALSLIWAHPMAAGSLCLLFYILGKNKK